MIIIFKPNKSVYEFEMFGKPKKFKESLEKTKVLDVYAKKLTKTQMTTSIQSGKVVFGYNHAVDGFKFHEQDVRNWTGGKTEHKAFFKLLESQGKEEYRKYVKILAEKVQRSFHVDIREVHIYSNVFVEDPGHDSDCALHNEPAYPKGECDCSFSERSNV